MSKKKDNIEVDVFNPLLSALRENDKKNLFKTNVTTAFLKTGFPLYDYFFGSVINIHDKDNKIIKQEPRVGQAAGTFNMVVGHSGSSKTSLCIQLANNIIRPFKNGTIIHYDCEHRMDLTRIENLTKLNPNDFLTGRYIFKQVTVGLDSIQEMIVKMYVHKMKLKNELEVETESLDEFGNKIKILPPTVIIIDSVTSVTTETLSWENSKDISNAEKLQSNTEGARSAKTFKGFLNDVLSMCKEANIIIFAINHINSNMQMNAFLPVAKQQNYLKQDESIPGGKALIFYSFNIVKMIAKPGDNFVEESDGFNGHIVMVEPIKSSTNQSGNNTKGVSFNLVFSFKDGMDSLRSTIMYGKDMGVIEGNKTRMKFKDNPSFTFSFKDIHNEAKEKPIWENIKKYIIPLLNENLPYIKPDMNQFDERSMDY